MIFVNRVEADSLSAVKSPKNAAKMAVSAEINGGSGESSGEPEKAVKRTKSRKTKADE